MTEILRFALAHARGDWRRTLAAAFAILVATTSFGVLTGSVSTARLVVTQTVEDNFRSTYDVLVRPAGSASAMEQSLGAVRPNFLTETFGGITLDQVRQITAITDVEVAAPVAVLGQVQRNVMLKVDVGQVLGTREHAMVRFSLNGAARNGTGETSTNHGYLYLTRSPLKSVDDVVEPANMSAQVEDRASGPVTVCLASSAGGRPATPGEAFRQFCTSVTGEDPGVVEALLMIPMAIQAIDPAAEHRLTGLDQAITTGRALTVDDGAGTADGPGGPLPTATAVMATSLPFDFRATLVVEELDPAGRAGAAGLENGIADVVEAALEGVHLQLQPVATVDIAFAVDVDLAGGSDGIGGLVVVERLALDHTAGLAQFGIAGGGQLVIHLAVDAVGMDDGGVLAGGGWRYLFVQPGAGLQGEGGALRAGQRCVGLSLCLHRSGSQAGTQHKGSGGHGRQGAPATVGAQCCAAAGRGSHAGWLGRVLKQNHAFPVLTRKTVPPSPATVCQGSGQHAQTPANPAILPAKPDPCPESPKRKCCRVRVRWRNAGFQVLTGRAWLHTMAT